MSKEWETKPGDRVLRRIHKPKLRLRRVLGIPALYSAGYGNVGSSIYYALGIVAMVAMGATPVALLLAGILFVFTALTYAEGTAMIPEAGGSASFARHAFGNNVGFLSGWALLLSYIVTISISAYTIPPYLGYFWEPLKESPMVGTVAAAGIIFFVIVLNVIGVKETSIINVIAAIFDVLTQIILIILGFVLLFDSDLLVHRITAYWPTTNHLFLGIALATLAYTGVETVSQMAEEAKRPAETIPRTLILMIFTVLILFTGISIVGLSVMTPQELATTWATDPVAGIAAGLSKTISPQELASSISSSEEMVIVLKWFFTFIQQMLKPLVSILAATILFIATNAGLMGISRLSFSLGIRGQLPKSLSEIHKTFKTPYIAILLFGGIAIMLVLPGLFAPGVFANMGALYTFGSLLTFTFAHVSIIALRIRRPDLPRPFKLGLNISIKNYEIPLTALIGFVATLCVWVVIVTTQPYSRYVGTGWMLIGMLWLLGRWILKRRRIESNSSKKEGTPPY